MAQLFVLSGSDAGRSFVVRGGARIGRGKDCEVHLREASVSRNHAHLEEQDGHWFVVDDGSRNGIQYESQRRDRLELKDHDEFQLGEMLLRFRLEDPVAESPRKPERPRPQPAPAAAPAAPAPEPDEIVLEGGGEEVVDSAPRAPVSKPAPVRAAAPAPPADPSGTRVARPPKAPAAGAGLEAKSRLLQYHRTENRRGAMVTDLTQYPLWLRWSVYTLVLALAVAIAFFAFKGTSSLREGMGLITLPPKP